MLSYQSQFDGSRNIGELCYESMLKGLSKEATLVLSNTRELDRVPKTK